MRTLKILLRFFLFCLLTVLTQVGGVVYLLSMCSYRFIDQWTNNKVVKVLCRTTAFLVLYVMITWWVVPIIARPLGRVPLPMTETSHLRPLNRLTCMLNRQYVQPELKQIALEVAEQMHAAHPGTVTHFLDGNFPFVNNFPLLPHLSHYDGKKLDLSFCYVDAGTGMPTNACPSFIGYGVCEEPLPGEPNTAAFCSEKGYFQYSFLTKIVSQSNKKDFVFDSSRTRDLVNLLAMQPMIGKIFIEPHLTQRLMLTSDKIRFHGCQAVRHDDHIHVQLR